MAIVVNGGASAEVAFAKEHRREIESGLLKAAEQGHKMLQAITKTRKGDLGVIGLSPQGELGIFFNTPLMARAYVDTSGQMNCNLF